MSNAPTGVDSYQLERGGDPPRHRPRQGAITTGPGLSGLSQSHYQGQPVCFTLAGWGVVCGIVTGSTRRPTELGLRFELVLKSRDETFQLLYDPSSKTGNYDVDLH